MKSRTLVGKVQLKLSALVFILPKNTAFWNQWNSEKTKKSDYRRKETKYTNNLPNTEKLNFNKTKSEITRHITSCIHFHKPPSWKNCTTVIVMSHTITMENKSQWVFLVFLLHILSGKNNSHFFLQLTPLCVRVFLPKTPEAILSNFS